MVRRNTSQVQPTVGVDLVELERAKAFYRAHRSRLDAYFSETEIAFVKRARRRGHERLAVLLAAKEAAFKASGQPWMGPEGFRSILVTPSPRTRTLACRMNSPLPVRRLSLTYFIRRHFVVARCAGTS
jgi:phosphopantetheine--protein transferase-like protein